MPELPTLLGERDRSVQRRLGQARGACGHAQPAAVERGERDAESDSLLADQVGRGDLAPIEQQLAHRRGLPPHLVLELAEVEPGPALLHDERGDSGGRVVAGPRHHEIDLGLPAVRDEPFAAAQAVTTVHALAPGLQRRGVRPALGLRECVRAEPLPREHPRQVPLLQVVGSELVDPERAQVMNGDADGERQVGARDLLDDREVREEGLPAAAEALFVGDPGQAHLAELAEQLAWELLLLFVGGRGGCGAVLGPPPGQSGQLPFLRRQPEIPIHGRSVAGGTDPEPCLVMLLRCVSTTR